MEDYFLDTDRVLHWAGTRMPFHPATGETWTEQLAEAYIQQLQRSIPDEQEEEDVEKDIYVGFIRVTDISVKAGTGEKITTSESDDVSEITVTKGSVVCISANVLADKTNAASVKTDLEKNVFRIPVVNQQTRERELFVCVLDKGVLTVEAPMDKAGYWQINQALINERLAEGAKFEMSDMLFAVVNTTQETLVKLKD